MQFCLKSIHALLLLSNIFFHKANAQLSTRIEVEEQPQKLPKPLSDMTATFVDETQLIYIFGGCDDPQGNSQFQPDLFICGSITSTGFSFNPLDGEFEALPDAPRARYRHTASNVNGKIWLVGGRTIEDNLIPEIDVFDPAKNTWSTLGVLPPQFEFSDLGSFYYEDYLYVVGGYNAAYEAQAVVFRIPTDENSLENGILTETMNPMKELRGDTHAVIVDGFAYITGGYSHEDSYCAPHTTTERYDISANEWTKIDDLRTGRADKVLVVLEGSLFALGGESKDSELCSGATAEYTMPLNDVEMLQDPHLDSSTWRVVSDTPSRVFRFSGAPYPPTNSIYTFGGQQFYNPSCECFATSDEVTKFISVLSSETSVPSGVEKDSIMTVIAVSSFTFILQMMI